VSLRSLKNDLDGVAERLYERIEETIEQHGLDPESDEVLDVVQQVFGATIRFDMEDWVVK
jgi:hypothetical protein